MDPITMAVIGGGIGLGKGILDQQREAKDRQMAAEIARWSPWTGMQTPMPKRADVLGSTMQGAMGGAMMGQNIAKAQSLQGAKPSVPTSDGISDDEWSDTPPPEYSINPSYQEQYAYNNSPWAGFRRSV